MNERTPSGKGDGPWIIAALLVLLCLGWHWWPWWPRGFIGPTRAERRLYAIPNNLRILEAAKEQYALEHRATNGTPVTTVDLAPYLKDGKRTLEMALDRWYQKQDQTAPPPTPGDLAPYLNLDDLVKPVAGEIYAIKPVGELNTVTIPKTLKGAYRGGGVFTVTDF
jgi:hypothetical protein